MLLLHAKEAWYKTVEPAIRDPPDPPSEASYSDVVVAFISVEDGDNVEVARRAAGEIVDHARRVGVGRALVYPFAHLSSSLAPPKEAYRVLVEVEQALKDLLGSKNVARAPFGWYKAFRVHCAGHPLCELSRTLRPGSTLYYSGRPAEEAGPADLLVEKPWSQDTVLLHARFQVQPRGRLGDVMISILDAYLSEALGAYRRLGWRPRESDSGAKAVAGLLRACRDLKEAGNASLGLGEGSVYGGELDASKMLSGLMDGFWESVERVPIGREGVWIEPSGGPEGYLLAYRSVKGALVPVAAYINGYTCIGPTDVVAKALLDHGLRLAAKDVTPTLPAWLAPIQAAVIPVKEKHVDYARSVLAQLAGEGVRVYLDPPTRGLGARIRAAARLWTPYILVIGDREVDSNTVTVRRRGSPEQEALPLAEAIEEILSAVRSGPGYQPLPPPPSQ